MKNRIREIRKERGLTMKELGVVVGLAESTISQYETGKRQPDNETLLRLAEYFGVTVDYLLGGAAPGPSITFDDFTYAMHGHSGELTEHDKKILLQMAAALADAHRKKETNGETDGDL